MNHDQRKIREAKILSKLTHPNILRLFDWWIE
jgi:serine/threonine protein kinase